MHTHISSNSRAETQQHSEYRVNAAFYWALLLWNYLSFYPDCSDKRHEGQLLYVLYNSRLGFSHLSFSPIKWLLTLENEREVHLVEYTIAGTSLSCRWHGVLVAIHGFQPMVFTTLHYSLMVPLTLSVFLCPHPSSVYARLSNTWLYIAF